MGSEMFRCAQHDNAVTHEDVWINLLICIIALLVDLSALAGCSAIQIKKLKSIRRWLQGMSGNAEGAGWRTTPRLRCFQTPNAISV